MDFSSCSLPDLADQLVQAQQAQTNELDMALTSLADVEREYLNAVKINDTLHGEICTVNKDIYVIRETSRESLVACGNLQNEVDKLLDQKASLIKDIQRYQAQHNEHQKIFTASRTKMMMHDRAVRRCEGESETNRAIVTAEGKIKALQAKCEALKNSWTGEQGCGMTADEKQSVLRKELAVVEAEKVKAGLCSHQLQEKITAEKECQKGMEQEIEMIKKRQAAQRTRAKRQLQEAHVRSRHLNNEAVQLQERIAVLQKLLHTP